MHLQAPPTTDLLEQVLPYLPAREALRIRSMRRLTSGDDYLAHVRAYAASRRAGEPLPADLHLWLVDYLLASMENPR